MKKMLIVLLSLGMILSGCIQNEHPEEPPVVEDETEKQPIIDENIDQDDIPIVDQPNNEKDDESNLGNEIVDGSNDDEQNIIKDEYVKKIDDTKSWFEIVGTTSLITNHNYSELNIDISTMNEEEKWLNEQIGEVYIFEYPFFNIDNEEAAFLNSDWGDPSNRNSEIPIGTGRQPRSYKCLSDSKILSVLIRIYVPGGYGITRASSINFDLTTGEKIKSLDLIERFGFTKEDYINSVKEYVESEFDYAYFERSDLIVKNNQLFALVYDYSQGIRLNKLIQIRRN